MLRIVITGINNYKLHLTILAILISVLFQSCTSLLNQTTETTIPESFSGERALGFVKYQTSLGPRIHGSPAHREVVAWITDQLEESGWLVEVQETTSMGHPIRNIVGKRSSPVNDQTPFILLGAHYDSRTFADEDPVPENRAQPVLGANDGASGVAVLLELARVLPEDTSLPIWLVFFDAEDNGRIPGWDWILGSTAFVEEMENPPDIVVIVDMIGDADLNIYKEFNSDPELTEEIWSVAARLGYSDVFLESNKYHILDDHTPFLEAGIPAVDIIDFDYEYWHTVSDTPDKVSAASLQAVGDTLVEWLLSRAE